MKNHQLSWISDFWWWTKCFKCNLLTKRAQCYSLPSKIKNSFSFDPMVVHGNPWISINGYKWQCAFWSVKGTKKKLLWTTDMIKFPVTRILSLHVKWCSSHELCMEGLKRMPGKPLRPIRALSFLSLINHFDRTGLPNSTTIYHKHFSY